MREYFYEWGGIVEFGRLSLTPALSALSRSGEGELSADNLKRRMITDLISGNR